MGYGGANCRYDCDGYRPDKLGDGIGQIPESSFQSRRAEAKHKPASGMLIKITATPATYPSAAAALPPPMPTTVTTSPQNMQNDLLDSIG